jgi:myosin heavy subunit
MLTAVLHAIKTRYEMHAPYTYSGIVLVSPPSTLRGLPNVQVAVNPFSPLSICKLIGTDVGPS